MLLALLRKDWRVNRTAIIGGTVIVLCPYPVLVLLRWMSSADVTAYIRSTSDASLVALVLTVLVASTVGGCALAAERRDRSAEFLAMLPIPRRRIVLSKLVVAGGYLAAGIVFHALVALACMAVQRAADLHSGFAAGSLAKAVVLAASAAFLFFALAWAMSTRIESAAIAASVAIAVALLLLRVVVPALDRAEVEYRAAHGEWVDYKWRGLVLVCLTVGALTLAVSTARYLRRVRP